MSESIFLRSRVTQFILFGTTFNTESNRENANYIFVCKNPLAIARTLNETVKSDVGQNYTYRCRDRLFGKRDQITTVTCLLDGLWTGTNFSCLCRNPPAKSAAIISKREVEIGRKYTYKYQAGKVAKEGKNPKVTCLPDVCSTPPTKHGAINELEVLEVGQNYSYKCQSGLFENGDLNPTIRCLEYGYWASTDFQCAPSISCDMGYINVTLEGTNVCIKVYRNGGTFDQAMTKCESEKANLLVVTTQTQIADLVNKTAENGTVWAYIGISDAANDGTWVSWDGQPVYPFWQPGEPSNSLQQNCAFLVI